VVSGIEAELPGDESFGPTAPWDLLQRRALLLRRLRTFFEQRGFLEVSTPLLSADTVVDRHLDPLRVTLRDDPRNSAPGRRLFLQTSPEFHMKRLLASGGQSIYQVTHAFRGGERGRLHNPEFTIVEWYRRGDTMVDGIQLLDELCQALLERGPARAISYGQAFLERLGIDPHRADRSELMTIARSMNLASGGRIDDRDTLLNLLLADAVQPHLGKSCPLILYDYPASQAALARVREDDPPVAERFELFVDGVELANGYHELLDPDQLRRRNRQVNRQRRQDGNEPLPEESRLLWAMEYGLPPSTGVAMGFDRVVMLSAGQDRLDCVLTFPIERA
jgi:lysyl-tRNA synthetase class 2